MQGENTIFEIPLVQDSVKKNRFVIQRYPIHTVDVFDCDGSKCKIAIERIFAGANSKVV